METDIIPGLQLNCIGYVTEIFILFEFEITISQAAMFHLGLLSLDRSHLWVPLVDVDLRMRR